MYQEHLSPDAGSGPEQPARFHPAVESWFAQVFGTPTEPQRLGWPAIQSGEDVLIAAPTGSGKTLAAFLAALDELFREGLRGGLPDETRVLYVSPLKALGNDIHRNLEQPLAGIAGAIGAAGGREVEVRSAVRSGDTPAGRRQAIARRPPHLLVTTPESLYLLLTSESGRRTLRTVRTVIIDEIHAVVANRRGSHLALSLERLSALTGARPQRIGLSATQRPISEVAKFLVGSRRLDGRGQARCRIVDCAGPRDLDLAIELPASPLEAVMSNEVWSEVYARLAELIRSHRTTLVFVNTRRLAERVARHLGEALGEGQVMPHHGSLSARLRLEAERRLKQGELKALVATSSLELGIDIGAVDLVCQIGAPRSIDALLQRIGRAAHRRGGRPKGRIFPLSRDELVESAAAVRSARRGELDRLHIPPRPLDILAQQMVACAACEDWREDELFELVRSAYPYRDLPRSAFQEVARMLAEGFSTRRGRRGSLLHRDAVNGVLRARRGARLLALTSGGAIADTSDYRVLLEPSETFVGTVNEDFAVESLAGDVFQLGNASWRILRVGPGVVRVEDAHGQPPGMPFWLGEAPGRSDELSQAVSRLRREIGERLGGGEPAACAWLQAEIGLPEAGALQLAAYFQGTQRALGAIPSQDVLALERFFDESGGMQLVLHSPFGIRVNRAWGLALRKRFCRRFNFELQAAANDDAIVISLGTQHSFPLEEVFDYLSSRSVREVLIQALLDAPMFPIRWRWNAARSLALPRQRGGRRVPAPLQRMEAENLMAAVFPDQLACPENLTGDREVPDHPLVQQTVEDCLEEAMDLEGLLAVLRRLEAGTIGRIARDLPEPSPLAHEILNARPYEFLDNAPLEERRTQAVQQRRSSEIALEAGLGALDPAAIERVREEAWPRAENAEEVHEALLLAGLLSDPDLERFAAGAAGAIEALRADRRLGRHPARFWVAAERLPLVQAVYGPGPEGLAAPAGSKAWERPEAIRELVRGRLEIAGPITAAELAGYFRLESSEIEAALLALEGEGFALRGRFRPGTAALEWCDRRLLARIHRLTLNRLRAEIQPGSIADFHRFLAAWQRVDADHRGEGPDAVGAALELLDGCELPAAAWEPAILSARVRDYDPAWLDQLCLTGRIGWGRLSPPAGGRRLLSPVRSSPVALFQRERLADWLALAPAQDPPVLSEPARRAWELLQAEGALFFAELARRSGVLPSRLEQALGELVAGGRATADSFEGLRALLVPEDRRARPSGPVPGRRHRSAASVEFAGRWTHLRSSSGPPVERAAAAESFAWALLRRYGVVFRRLIQRESLSPGWFDLTRIYRRLEARGEIRGGHFVAGVGGEQFALPEAVGLLRSLRRTEGKGELVALSAADPLNLSGLLGPGPRVPAIARHRLLLRDGLPVAALQAGRISALDPQGRPADRAVEEALRVGRLPAALRRVYA